MAEYRKKKWVNGEVIYEDDLNRMEEGIAEALKNRSHAENKNNPHSVTIAQIGAAPAYDYSPTDITAGSTALTTGKQFLVYE